MKTLVIYDSQYGNTEQVAKAIAEALAKPIGASEAVGLRHVGEVTPGSLDGVSLLVVGSPTQRFAAKPGMKDFLAAIPNGALRGVRVAAFDTRFPQQVIGETPPLGFFVKVWGKSAWAATHIARALRKKGGQIASDPQGFYVSETEGPLLEGELERAAAWAAQLVEQPEAASS